MNLWSWYWLGWLLAFLVPELYWVFTNPVNTLSEEVWRFEGLNMAQPFDFAMWTDVHWAVACLVWVLFFWLSIHIPFGLLGREFMSRNIKFRPGVKFTPHNVPRLFAEDYYTSDVVVQYYHRDYTDFTAPMLGNDTVGDCTIAGIMHCAGAQSKYGAGTELNYTTQQAMNFYEKCWGYVPGEPWTDEGGTLQGTLQYAKANPGVIPGYNLDAFAQLRNLSWQGISTGLMLFGTVYLAVNLPESAENQFNAEQPWTVVQGSPIAGGHCITLTGFVGGTNSGRVATWGESAQEVQMAWWNHYGVEAWVPYSREWLRSSGVAPNGLNETALLKDMSIIGD